MPFGRSDVGPALAASGAGNRRDAQSASYAGRSACDFSARRCGAVVAAGESASTAFASGADVLTSLQSRGALFFHELTRQTGRLASEVEDGLWELVAAGLVTADGFENLRALIDPKRRRGEGKGRTARPRHAAGRWALLERGDGCNECRVLREGSARSMGRDLPRRAGA